MSETYRVRASSIGTLLDCSARWYAEQVIGMTKPSSGRMHLGTTLHRSTAAVDTRRMNGDPMSMEEASETFHDAFANPENEIDWRHDDVNVGQAESIGHILNITYHGHWSPKFEFSAVEGEAKDMIVEIPEVGINIKLTGKMDRCRTIKNDHIDHENWSMKSIIDLKSGKRAVVNGVADTKGHAAQLGVYEILEEHQSGEPCNGDAGIIAMQTSSKPTIAEGFISRPRDLLIGTEQEPGLLEMIGKMLKYDIFPGNPKSMLCDKRYCAAWDKCKWRG